MVNGKSVNRKSNENYEEGDLEIHLADFGGYHQRDSDEPGSIELPGLIKKLKR